MATFEEKERLLEELDYHFYDIEMGRFKHQGITLARDTKKIEIGNGQSITVTYEDDETIMEANYHSNGITITIDDYELDLLAKIVGKKSD